MSRSLDAAPTISVALCTYNSGPYIEAQLRSILGQELPVDEVIVGDDGSTDGTLERIAAVAESHPRGGVVRVAFTEPSGGVVPNFSRTLAACSGTVVALADHDDVWHASKTATLVPRLLAAGPRAMVFSDAVLVDSRGEADGRRLFAAYGVSAEELEAIESGHGATALIRRNIVTGATAMLTHDLLEVALPIPERFVHDEWLAFLAAALGTLAVERTPLIDYRVHGSNQIGVPPSTLGGQARVALRGRRRRYEDLRERAQSLRERLAEQGADAEVVALVDAKQAFESARAAMPAVRLARLAGIWRRYRHGDYARFTHRPSLERWRDAVQSM